MTSLLRKAAFLIIPLGLAACANRSNDASFTTPAPTGLSQADIRGIFSGKSWNWASPKNSGQTLYAADGTSLVEVTGKGTTTGKWIAKDGQLCESYNPAPFLPAGAALTCQPVTGSSGNYQVGQANFTPA
jgi:Protein of unknown function (DUF995)